MKKKAKYRKIPIYYDPTTDEVKGRNWFYDLLVNVMVWIDVHIIKVEDFPIYMELTEKDKKILGIKEKKRNLNDSFFFNLLAYFHILLH